MFKRLFLIFVILSVSLFAKESKYLKKDEYSNIDFRIFVGLDGFYSYVRSDKSLDPSMYAYGIYIGLPIYKNNELILKRKINLTNNHTLYENSLTLNIPFMSRSSRQTYFGLIAGEGKIVWDDDDIKRLGLNNKIVKDNFYGLSLGKRFKYTRNYHLRTEFQVMKYMHDTKSSIEDVNGLVTIGFNLAFEYRF